MGHTLCDIWVCFDVLCCTASILHLVCVALDRYWAVTSAAYIRQRSAWRIGAMIVVVWVAACVISIPSRVNTQSSSVLAATGASGAGGDSVCQITGGLGYAIFSTVGAFYMPMFFMIAIYLRIYQVVRQRIRKTAFTKTAVISLSPKEPGVNLLDEPANQSKESRSDFSCKGCKRSAIIQGFCCVSSSLVSSKLHHCKVGLTSAQPAEIQNRPNAIGKKVATIDSHDGGRSVCCKSSVKDHLNSTRRRNQRLLNLPLFLT
ncbi:unnamed protein product, partial [Protopolystoma xenopodis]